MRRPKAKFAVGDYVTNLFFVGVIAGKEYQPKKKFKYPGWWYQVETEEDGTVWMHEPDMVKIEPETDEAVNARL